MSERAGATPPDFARCVRCVGHELTRDICFYEGRCVRPEIEHTRSLVEAALRRATGGEGEGE